MKPNKYAICSIMGDYHNALLTLPKKMDYQAYLESESINEIYSTAIQILFNVGYGKCVCI